ncbi:MAG: hypothetical protein ACKO9V_07550 [Candidatus Kapaibacterium sp.]
MVRIHIRIVTIFIVALATSAASILSAQCWEFTRDSVRVLVGETASLPIRLRLPSTSEDSLWVSVRLRISNPTVAYPVEIRSADAGVSALRWVPTGPGILTIRFAIRNRNVSVAAMELRCLALAGSDSVCLVSVDSVTVDGGSPCPGDSLVFSSSNTDHDGTYLRPLGVGPTTPLPCEQCAGLRWTVRSDRMDTVRVEIVDLAGRSVDAFRAFVTAGENIIVYDHRAPQVYNGLYAAVFRSATGTAVRLLLLVD